MGEALAEQGVAPKGGPAPAGADGAGDDDMAAQWAAMIEDGGQFVQAGNKGGAERILNQEEIDSLLGFNLADITLNETRASGRSSIRRWSPTSACRCSKSSSTAWCG